jgi:hypothetical protein
MQEEYDCEEEACTDQQEFIFNHLLFYYCTCDKNIGLALVCMWSRRVLTRALFCSLLCLVADAMLGPAIPPMCLVNRNRRVKNTDRKLHKMFINNKLQRLVRYKGTK